jgi:anti-anti-sigma factor
MIEVRQCDNVTVVQPAMHRLDELLGRQLIASMREYIVPGAKIVLNLSHVVYLNSEAMGYISTCARRMAHNRGAMAVCCLQDGPRGVFRILRMEKVLQGIYDTEDEAVTACQQHEPPRKITSPSGRVRTR